MRCVMWRSGWMLTNRGQPSWIDEWIVQWRRHMYHRWCQLISIWVTVLSIKALVIMRSEMWRSGWLLTNRGHMRWINDWIIQWRRHRYHQQWQLVALWLTVVSIKAPVITGSHSLPTLIVPYSTFVATTNTLETWNDEYNMSLWWNCVPVILLVNGHQKVRAKILARQLQSCLSFITRNKNWLRNFCLNIILIRL